MVNHGPIVYTWIGDCNSVIMIYNYTYNSIFFLIKDFVLYQVTEFLKATRRKRADPITNAAFFSESHNPLLLSYKIMN